MNEGSWLVCDFEVDFNAISQYMYLLLQSWYIVRLKY